VERRIQRAYGYSILILEAIVFGRIHKHWTSIPEE
jgi:hypothetical protein